MKDFGDNAFIISDEFFLEKVNKEALSSIKENGLSGFVEKFNYECTKLKWIAWVNLLLKIKRMFIIGIGGGKTLDVSKSLICLVSSPPVILFPTIASTDAPCTALFCSFIKKMVNLINTYFLPQNPDMVIADAAIIASAPQRFFSAGVGDALCHLF